LGEEARDSSTLADNQGRAPWLPRAGRYSAAASSFTRGFSSRSWNFVCGKTSSLNVKLPSLFSKATPPRVPVALALGKVSLNSEPFCIRVQLTGYKGEFQVVAALVEVLEGEA